MAYNRLMNSGASPPRTGSKGRAVYDLLAVLPYYYPEPTGHCQSCNSLLPYLAASGLKTAVLTCNRLYSRDDGKLPPLETYRGVDVFRFGLPARRRTGLGSSLLTAILFFLRALWGVCRIKARSVLCITSPPLLFWAIGLVCRVRRIPLFLWAMDLYPEVLVGMGIIKWRGLLDRALRRLARAGYRHCTTIFTLGPVMTGRILDYGIPASKVTTLHNWADEELERIADADNRLLRDWGLEDKFVVQYAGSMGLGHTFGTFLAAADQLKARCPNVVFLMVGGGERKGLVEQEARRRGLTNVVVRGYVPFEYRAELMSLAHVGLVSLKHGLEGVIAPCKTYAYQKIGCPVVLEEEAESDLTRILADDVEGIVVRPGDEARLVAYLEELAKNPDRIAEGRRRNAEWYRRHCALEANASAFLDEIRRHLSTPPS